MRKIRSNNHRIYIYFANVRSNFIGITISYDFSYFFLRCHDDNGKTTVAAAVAATTNNNKHLTPNAISDSMKKIRKWKRKQKPIEEINSNMIIIFTSIIQFHPLESGVCNMQRLRQCQEQHVDLQTSNTNQDK